MDQTSLLTHRHDTPKSRFKSLFGYYGGKSKLAHLYPAPKYDVIIEPFAGGASYSLRYYERNVHLYDADPITADIWRFLLSPTALELCHKYIPKTAAAGDRITDLLIPEAADKYPGLLRLMQAEANCGTQGAKGIHNQVTSMAVKGWHRILPKLDYWLPKIRHWRFVELPYSLLANCEATWFIDPPYNNEAGRRYRTQIGYDHTHLGLDYAALGDWCRSRAGQVIVCENAGATWLPFQPLAERRGVMSSYQKSRAMEVVYTQ